MAAANGSAPREEPSRPRPPSWRESLDRRTAWLLSLAVATAVGTVLLSSLYLTRFPPGEVPAVAPWQFPLWVLLPFLLSGGLFALTIAHRPRLFWPLLVASATFTAGMNVLRFTLFDEWLAAWLAVGAVLAVNAGAVPRRERVRHRLWVSLFLLLVLHLLASSILGMVAFGEPKALRFTVVYAVVLVLGCLLAFYRFPTPGPREVTLLLAAVCLGYFAFNLAHAYAFHPWFWANGGLASLGVGGAGGGYQMFAGVVGLGAAVVLVGHERGRTSVLGWAVIVGAMWVTALADTRGGVVAFLGVLVLAPLVLRPQRWMSIVAAAAVGSVLVGLLLFARPEWPLDILGSAVDPLNAGGGSKTITYYGREVVGAEQDAGRNLFVAAALEAVARLGPLGAWVGAGAYGYYPVAGPVLWQMNLENGIPNTSISAAFSVAGEAEWPRPPALGAMIVESGVLGMMLLAACGVAAMFATGLRRRNGGHGLAIRTGPSMMAAGAVPIAFTWMYFGHVQDIILFFLLIMPYGLVHAWGSPEVAAGAPGQPPAPVTARGPRSRPPAAHDRLPSAASPHPGGPT